jgi:hypothetical protein
MFHFIQVYVFGYKEIRHAANSKSVRHKRKCHKHEAEGEGELLQDVVDEKQSLCC